MVIVGMKIKGNETSGGVDEEWEVVEWRRRRVCVSNRESETGFKRERWIGYKRNRVVVKKGAGAGSRDGGGACETDDTVAEEGVAEEGDVAEGERREGEGCVLWECGWDKEEEERDDGGCWRHWGNKFVGLFWSELCCCR